MPKSSLSENFLVAEREKLTAGFYTRDVLTVAKELLGNIFTVEKDGKILSAVITEVEAYKGDTDEAAHSFGGITERNKIMFEEGGKLYVYFIYGAHFCANVVTGKKGEGDAVLLRGMYPVSGLEFFAENRYGKRVLDKKELNNLLNGPGKICKAFGIDKSFNGINITGDTVYILKGEKNNEIRIQSTERIGISKSKELKWRFFIEV